MAEKEAAGAAEAVPAKKGKSKLFLIIGIAAAALTLGGGVTAFFLTGKKDAKAAAQAKLPPKKVPVFVEMDAFTVNLRDEDADRFLQVKLVAEVKDNVAGEMLKTMMPAVRSEILLLLGSKQSSDLATREGKEKLRGELIAAANKPLERTTAEKAVEGVNFTQLIIQ